MTDAPETTASSDDVQGLVTAAWCGDACPKFTVNGVTYGLNPADATAPFRWMLILQRMQAGQPVHLQVHGVVLANTDAPTTFPNCILIY